MIMIDSCTGLLIAPTVYDVCGLLYNSFILHNIHYAKSKAVLKMLKNERYFTCNWTRKVFQKP